VAADSVAGVEEAVGVVVGPDEVVLAAGEAAVAATEEEAAGADEAIVATAGEGAGRSPERAAPGR
jgi:hypothetical protein